MEVAPRGGMEALSVALLNQSGIDCAASSLRGAVWRGDKGVTRVDVVSSCWLSMFFNQSVSSGWAKDAGSEAAGGILPKLLNHPKSSCEDVGCAGSLGDGAGVSPKLFNQLKSYCDAGCEEAGVSKDGGGALPKLFSQLKSSCDDDGCEGVGASKDGAGVPPKLFNQLISS